MSQVDKIKIDESTYDIAASANATNKFVSGDTTTSESKDWTEVDTMATGEANKSIFNKISTMFKNIRFLKNIIGDGFTTTETVSKKISDIGSSGGSAAVKAVVTLTAEGWVGNTQKVANEIFKTGDQYVYTVSPLPEDIRLYSIAGVAATVVDDSGMTFTCIDKPNDAIRVNISMVEAKK